MNTVLNNTQPVSEALCKYVYLLGSACAFKLRLTWTSKPYEVPDGDHYFLLVRLGEDRESVSVIMGPP